MYGWILAELVQAVERFISSHQGQITTLVATSRLRRVFAKGTPILSPILFHIVADMLSILVGQAKVAGQISGEIPCLAEDGFFHSTIWR
jgi:hypothetical protein